MENRLEIGRFIVLIREYWNVQLFADVIAKATHSPCHFKSIGPTRGLNLRTLARQSGSVQHELLST